MGSRRISRAGPAAALAALLAACTTGGQPAGPDATGAAAPPDGTPTATRTSPWPTTLPGSEPPPTPTPEVQQLTINAAGDILPHAPVLANAQLIAGGDGYDFTPMFADVRDMLSAPDLTLCHLETPISLDNANVTQPRVLVFSTPYQIADALAGAGFDGCDFASNHAVDQGISGLRATQRALEEAGLEYAGPTAEESAAGEPAVYQVDGLAVAQLAYSYTLLNSATPNTDVPDGAPWLEDYLWLERGAEGIISDAQDARADGADFVVVSMHWGTEYQSQPTEQQRELARQLLRSEAADLILGTHVHVIQPCEKINGRYVVYGLGNFLSNQSPDTTGGYLLPATQEGLMVSVDLTRAPDGTVTSQMAFQPTRVDLDGHVIRLATPEQYPETYERTVDTVLGLGEDACDATPVSGSWSDQ